jgi:hypothetical protein
MQMVDEPGLALSYSNVCLQQGERTWDYRHEQGIAMIHSSHKQPTFQRPEWHKNLAKQVCEYNHAASRQFIPGVSS